IREEGVLQLPPSIGVNELVLRGEFRPHPDARGLERGAPTLTCFLDGQPVGGFTDLKPGTFDRTVPISAASAHRGPQLVLRLGGVGLTNHLAWLGRVTRFGPWQRFRAQNKNRQVRIATLTTGDGETIFDFSIRLAPLSMAFARRHTAY